MISIIIPTYKREAKLNKMIGKILGADSHGVQFEIIVVNDDEDKISDIKGINLVQPLKNSGGQVARGIGLRHAKYNWILFLDDDDDVVDDFFLILKENLSGSFDILYFDLLIENKRGIYKYNKMSKKLATRPWLQNTLFQNKIYNRDLLKEIYFSKIMLYQDENIFFKAVTTKSSYKIINKPIIKYNYNFGSVSKFDDYRKKFDRLKINYEEFVIADDTKMTLFARGRLFSFLVYWNKLGKLGEAGYLKRQKKISKLFTNDDRGRLFLSLFKI